MTYINLHTHHPTDAADVLELVNQYPHEFDDSVDYFSIGIHPWFIEEDRLEADFEVMEQKLTQRNCLAAGECGLDKRNGAPMDLQTMVFERQLLLAEKYRKPVILHCVAAYQEIVEMKTRLEITVPMIIHGFSKKEELAAQMVEKGIYLSFGKHLLRNRDLQSVFTSVPDDHYFLETDFDDDTIAEVYELAASYKKLSVEQVKEQVNTNFKRVFNFINK